jgi:hypothetical protein
MRKPAILTMKTKTKTIQPSQTPGIIAAEDDQKEMLQQNRMLLKHVFEQQAQWK